MCDPNFSKPFPLWRITHCADWLLHLSTRSNFRIRLLLGCHGLESDTSRFSSQSNGQACGDPSCKLCGAQLEDAPHFISSCPALETKHRELLRHAPLQLELPNHACDPDLFAHIMLKTDWIEDIQAQVFLHQSSSRALGVQSRTHSKFITSPPLSGTLPEREAIKKKDKSFASV